MQVSLRFYVQSLTENAGGTHSLTMAPNYKDGANKEWAKYTPGGLINLSLGQEAAVEFYKRALREHKTVKITMEIEDDTE